MAELRHSLENIPVGALTGGSGGNTNQPGSNFFDSITKPASAVIEAIEDPVFRGQRAVRVRTAGTAGLNAMVWSASRALITDDYTRFMLRLESLPTINQAIAFWYSAALASMGALQMNADGTITLRTPGGVSNIASATVLSLDRWYRIEAKHHADLAAGQLTCRIYTDPDAPIASFAEEYSYTVAQAMPTAQSKRWDIGLPTGSANQPSGGEHLIFDEIVNSATTWVGPVPGGFVPKIGSILV